MSVLALINKKPKEDAKGAAALTAEALPKPLSHGERVVELAGRVVLAEVGATVVGPLPTAQRQLSQAWKSRRVGASSKPDVGLVA